MFGAYQITNGWPHRNAETIMLTVFREAYLYTTLGEMMYICALRNGVAADLLDNDPTYIQVDHATSLQTII